VGRRNRAATYELGKNAKGSSTNIEQIDEAGKYSWIKAPRWKGHAMEVGPLARYIIGYVQKNPEFKDPVDMVLKKLDLPLTALFSTLGRTAARGLEASWAAHKMRYFQDKLMANLKAGDLSTANIDKWEPSTWPAETKGVGFTEAPRGALAPLDHASRTRASTTTSASCRPPGTAARATPRARSALLRPA
jgi:hydrogenase large subunit